MITDEQEQLIREVLFSYQREEISFGRLREILGVGVLEAQHLLAQYNIPLNLDIEDWEKERDYLRKIGFLK